MCVQTRQFYFICDKIITLYCWIGKAELRIIQDRYKDVKLDVKNENHLGISIPLNLSKVLYTLSGSINLLILDKLEHNGWGFITLKNQQYAWLKNGEVILKVV